MTTFFIDKIPFRTYKVEMEFKAPAKFPYFHGPKLYALLCGELDIHPLGKSIVLYPAETVHIKYSAGDKYNFALTCFGEDDKFLSSIWPLLHKQGNAACTNTWIQFNTYKDVTAEYKEFLLNRNYSCKRINLITPLRMLRSGNKRNSRFTTSIFETRQFLKLLHKRIHSIARECGIEVEEYYEPELPRVSIAKKKLLYFEDRTNKVDRGIFGYVEFKEELDEFWKSILKFGQIAHAGNNTAMGFGRYYLDELNYTADPVKPARTFLSLAIEPDNLFEAFKHIKSNMGDAGTDGIYIGDYNKSLLENLSSISSAIRDSTYKPSPLKGLIFPKSESKIRALAVPTVKDRVIQRAVVQVINDTAESLMEENSFAYRRGLSRRNAADAISKAYKDGFKFVLEADINSFFDNVNWDILFDKMKIIFRNDPVVKYIEEWVTCKVEYEGKLITRNLGLPQGAVISPMLANLFLDELDESLGAKFKLIRYADDFVVLCKSEEEANKAMIEVEKVLKSLDLELKDEKTGVRLFENGFRYLGYLFVRSLVLDPPGKDDERQSISTEEFAGKDFKIPLNSWLTGLDLNKIKKVGELAKKTPLSVPLPIPEVSNKKYPVYITRVDADIRTQGDIFVVKYPEAENGPAKKIPMSDIAFVSILGASKITLYTILRLKENNIPVFLARRNGELREAFEIKKRNYALWLRQAELQNDPEFKLGFVKEIISSKIHNQKIVALRYGWDNDVVEEFNRLELRCRIHENSDSLRGAEGRAAALYFENLINEIPVEWGFTAREKRPPKDPVNALLSFGYSILYHNISSALIYAGLNPVIGWMHLGDSYNTLAADIQEEFRHIIDRLVVYIIKRKILAKSDFIYDKKAKYPCLLKSEPRKKFILQIEKRFQTEFKFPEFKNPVNYRYYFYQKAISIVSICRDASLSYKAFRIK